MLCGQCTVSFVCATRSSLGGESDESVEREAFSGGEGGEHA